MAKVQDPPKLPSPPVPGWCSKFAASEGSTLAGAARTDDPPAVPMSGGQGPAGAAKPSEDA